MFERTWFMGPGPGLLAMGYPWWVRRKGRVRWKRNEDEYNEGLIIRPSLVSQGREFLWIRSYDISLFRDSYIYRISYNFTHSYTGYARMRILRLWIMILLRWSFFDHLSSSCESQPWIRSSTIQPIRNNFWEMILEKSSSDMGTCFNILSVSLSDMSERQLQTVRYFPKSYLRSSEWTSITKSRG